VGTCNVVPPSYKTYVGDEDPSLREWTSTISDAVLRIPDGANDATLIPYLMFVTVGGMAKDVLRIENQSELDPSSLERSHMTSSSLCMVVAASATVCCNHKWCRA
jgi:hypothetical protein